MILIVEWIRDVSNVKQMHFKADTINSFDPQFGVTTNVMLLYE